MKQLQTLFEKFQNIKYDYQGKSTNWKEKAELLDNLYNELEKIKIPSSKNSLWYEYILRCLKTDIFEESKRVWKLYSDIQKDKI